jgi:hypothetical protein
MKRGIIELRKDEVKEVLRVMPEEVFTETPLENKLNSAVETTDEHVKLEISADELEVILDEIAVPLSDNEPQPLKSVRKKIQMKLTEFRESRNGF